VACAAAVLAVAWAGRAAEGRRALADSDAARARGDLVDAVLAARTAAEARCPGCGSPDEGFRRLEDLAKDAELRGDDATAFAAWRAARAAILATDPASARRARTDAEVARLAHRIDVAATVAGAPPTAAAAEDRLRATLAEDSIPSMPAFAVIAAGGALFLFGAARFAFALGRTSWLGRAGAIDALLAVAGAALAVAGGVLF
jgi:hypothetical protein